MVNLEQAHLLLKPAKSPTESLEVYLQMHPVGETNLVIMASQLGTKFACERASVCSLFAGKTACLVEQESEGSSTS